MALTSDEIAARFAAIETDEAGGFSPVTPRFVRPLSEIGDSLIDALQVEQGLNLGLPQIDVLTRGFRPTDLVLITGFATSGKTQLVNTMLTNARDKRIIFFSLDDPAELILAKLVAMQSGVSSERIEQRIGEGDAATIRLVLETARDAFPNLLIVDESLSIDQMIEAISEAEQVWGDSPDAVIIDYVEMIPHPSVDTGQRVKLLLNQLKVWANQATYPLIVVHQGTRSNAKPGEPVTLLSLGFSGEQQATLVLGVRRKRDAEEASEHSRKTNDSTVTVHLLKNKRPGGRVTHYEGIDFHMAPETGLITPLTAAGVAARVQERLEVA